MPSTSDDSIVHLRALTLSAVADLLAISEDTARRLCESGRLRSITIGVGERRKARRVLVKDLEAYVESQAGPLPSPKKRKKAKTDGIMEFIT